MTDSSLFWLFFEVVTIPGFEEDIRVNGLFSLQIQLSKRFANVLKEI